MQRIDYLDFLRGISIIAVILIHVSGYSFYKTNGITIDWFVGNFYDASSRWSVPVFVMISGSLFLDEKKLISIKRLYSKNILRITSAFFFWSSIYALYTQISNPGNHNVAFFIGNILKGHHHMWFLFMICGIYLLLPILKPLGKNIKIEQYFLTLSFLVAFIYPLVYDFLFYWVPQSHTLIEILDQNFRNLKINLLSGYLFYFVLGHYVHNFVDNKKTLKYFMIIGMLSTFLIIALTTFIYYYYGNPNEYFYHYVNILPLLQSIGVYSFIKLYYNLIKEKFSKIDSIVVHLSKYSLGIYLVHILYFYLILKIPINFIPSLLSILLQTTVVGIISYYTCLILNKIPFINKYIL